MAKLCPQRFAGRMHKAKTKRTTSLCLVLVVNLQLLPADSHRYLLILGLCVIIFCLCVSVTSQVTELLFNDRNTWGKSKKDGGLLLIYVSGSFRTEKSGPMIGNRQLEHELKVIRVLISYFILRKKLNKIMYN